MIARVVGATAALGAAVALGQLAPSVASLGQWAPVRHLGRCTWRGTGPRVAFTFDDGPSPDTTPALLDELDALGVAATFFCLGSAVDRHPDLVRETVRRGHQVGTHGYEHRHHLGAGPRWIRTDLEQGLAALAAAGVTTQWFRPPYGQVSTGTVLAARHHHLRLALWSAWGREWACSDHQAVVAQVARGLAPGAVVLLHDSDVSSPEGSALRARQALGPLVAQAKGAGLRPVTLDQLLGDAVAARR